MEASSKVHDPKSTARGRWNQVVMPALMMVRRKAGFFFFSDLLIVAYVCA